MKLLKYSIFFAIILGAIVLTLSKIETQKIQIDSEDSVYPLIKKVVRKYQRLHPGVKIQLQVVESVATLPIFLHQDKGVKPDLIFTEDTYLLKALNGVKSKELALNPIVICYDKDFKLTNTNWMQVVTSHNFGFSNPDTDPLGYYVHFIFSLYNKEHHTDYQCKSKYTRNSTTDLFWLMKSGNLDFIFTYKSFAIQNHLKYFELPTPYNLVSNINYSVVSYTLSNKKVIPGHVSSFGVGIVNENKSTKEFLDYLFSKTNTKLFTQLGLIQK